MRFARTYAIAVRMLMTLLSGVLVLPLTRCGSFTPGTINPLAGTWHAVSRNPGTTFVGKIVFDYRGDLTQLQISTYKDSLDLDFDGQSHLDNGDAYTATSHTTVTGDDFTVKGYVEFAEGKRQGMTYVTVKGTVRYGSMSGMITIAFPGSDSVSFNFDGTRS